MDHESEELEQIGEGRDHHGLASCSAGTSRDLDLRQAVQGK